MKCFSFLLFMLVGLYYIEPFESEFAVHDDWLHSTMQHTLLSDSQPEIKDALLPLLMSIESILFFVACLIGLLPLVYNLIKIFKSILYSSIPVISDFVPHPSIRVLRI